MEFNATLLAVLNSTKYRTRYVEEIKNDFPSIPPLSNVSFMQRLTKLGQRLTRAQLLQTEVPDSGFRFSGKIGGEIEAARHAAGRVYFG